MRAALSGSCGVVLVPPDDAEVRAAEVPALLDDPARRARARARAGAPAREPARRSSGGAVAADHLRFL